jgi:c-di-GMP-binding flagellar brake protein YcgR
LVELDRTIPEGERDAMLNQACGRNLPVEVLVVGRTDPVPLRSRLLRNGSPSSKTPMIIESPTRNGAAVVVHPNEAVNVLMMFGGHRYGFRAAVVDRGRMLLGGTIEVATLSIEYPQKVIKLQRRRFYRAKIPGLDPIVVRCVLKPPGDRDDPGKEEGFVKFESTVTDISSGGMGIRVPAAFARHVRQGARMALLFQLDGFSKPVRLLAEVRNIRQIKDSRDYVAGLQYVEWHRTMAGRRSINWITRFVVKRQRAELRKKSGLE